MATWDCGLLAEPWSWSTDRVQAKVFFQMSLTWRIVLSVMRLGRLVGELARAGGDA